MRTGPVFDDVLAAAQAGAGWAFEVLYRDLSPVVTGYLRLHGAAEPDDLASETFLGVFTGLAGFSGDEDALRSWVFTIAHRRLIDDWRRRSRRPQLTDDAGDLTLLPGGDAEMGEEPEMGEVEAVDATDEAPVEPVLIERRSAQRPRNVTRLPAAREPKGGQPMPAHAKTGTDGERGEV